MDLVQRVLAIGLSSAVFLVPRAALACLTSAQCSGQTPICNTLEQTCRPCASDLECGALLTGLTCATSGPSQGACVEPEADGGAEDASGSTDGGSDDADTGASSSSAAGGSTGVTPSTSSSASSASSPTSSIGAIGSTSGATDAGAASRGPSTASTSEATTPGSSSRSNATSRSSTAESSEATGGASSVGGAGGSTSVGGAGGSTGVLASASSSNPAWQLEGGGCSSAADAPVRPFDFVQFVLLLGLSIERRRGREARRTTPR